jgi:hypothetical protein
VLEIIMRWEVIRYLYMFPLYLSGKYLLLICIGPISIAMIFSRMKCQYKEEIKTLLLRVLCFAIMYTLVQNVIIFAGLSTPRDPNILYNFSYCSLMSKVSVLIKLRFSKVNGTYDH